MLRRILACVFAVLATCGHAADSIVYYGPSGNVLTAGKYQRVTVSWKNGQPVMETVTMMDVGGSIVPPPPPPPPVDDVSAKVAGYLAAVTDPDKAAMQSKLAKGYSATVGLADAGTITDVAALKTIQQMVDKQLVSKVSAAWKPWTDGMTALVTAMDFQATLSAYRIAQSQLGGGPVPPPPPPPPPVTTAAKAVILRESGNQSQPMASMLNQLRNDQSWSKLVEILDPQQKTESGQPDPLTQSLLSVIGSRPLPRLVLLNAEGSFVGDSDLPATFDALKKTLTEKGVRP